jgi:hypothetical protein
MPITLLRLPDGMYETFEPSDILPEMQALCRRVIATEGMHHKVMAVRRWMDVYVHWTDQDSLRCEVSMEGELVAEFAISRSEHGDEHLWLWLQNEYAEHYDQPEGAWVAVNIFPAMQKWGRIASLNIIELAKGCAAVWLTSLGRRLH